MGRILLILILAGIALPLRSEEAISNNGNGPPPGVGAASSMSALDLQALQKMIGEALTKPIVEEMRQPTGFSALQAQDKRRRTQGFITLRLDKQMFGGVQSASYIDLGLGLLQRYKSMDDKLRVEFSFRKYTATGENSFGRLDFEYRF
jgi:hypothetical protein